MINIYHLENSRSFRIVWLLEELNVPYELHKFKRINGVAGDDFKLVSKYYDHFIPLLTGTMHVGKHVAPPWPKVLSSRTEN